MVRGSTPIQTAPGAHPGYCTMGTGFLSLGVKQLGPRIYPTTPSSAKVKERLELYLYSPFGPS